MTRLSVGPSWARRAARRLVVIVHAEASLDYHVAVVVLVFAVLIWNKNKCYTNNTNTARCSRNIPDSLAGDDWPMWGMQGSGLQFSFSGGLSCSSQPSLESMSSDRQRNSRTRKPPSHVFEHWSLKSVFQVNLRLVWWLCCSFTRIFFDFVNACINMLYYIHIHITCYLFCYMTKVQWRWKSRIQGQPDG